MESVNGLESFLKTRQELLDLGKKCQKEGGAVINNFDFLELILDGGFVIKRNEPCPDGLYQSTLFCGGFLYHCVTEEPKDYF